MSWEYVLFPTEAHLLGECLGEYQVGGGYFFDFVRRRLRPMMPSYSYRKEAAHEMDSFRCTFAEARFIAAGIRPTSL